jgi:hypothetical protein
MAYDPTKIGDIARSRKIFRAVSRAARRIHPISPTAAHSIRSPIYDASSANKPTSASINLTLNLAGFWCAIAAP